MPDKLMPLYQPDLRTGHFVKQKKSRTERGEIEFWRVFDGDICGGDKALQIFNGVGNWERPQTCNATGTTILQGWPHIKQLHEMQMTYREHWEFRHVGQGTGGSEGLGQYISNSLGHDRGYASSFVSATQESNRDKSEKDESE